MEDTPPTPRSTFGLLADRVARARRLGLLFIALAVAGVASLPLLSFDFSPQTLFDATSERARVYAEYRANYGADDHALMLLVDGDLNKAGAWAAVAEIEAAIAADVPSVEWTQSVLSVPVPRSPQPGQVDVAPLVDSVPRTDAEAAALAEAARSHPLLVDTLISEDATLACVLMKLHDDVAKLSDVKPVVLGLRDLAETAAARHDGLSTHLVGPPAYRVTVVGVMVREEIRFVPLTGLVLAFVLLILFRSPAGVLVPLLSVGLGALWTVAAMALTGQEINIINTITATLVLVIGAADAIHMMVRYGQERREGLDREAATRRALVSVGAACLLTSVTTAVGFMTLLSADLAILRSFGVYAALGVMITFGFTIVFVPWALTRSPVDPVVEAPSSKALEAILDRQARFTQRHPWAVLIVGLVVAAGFVAGIPRTQVNNFIMEYVPEDDAILEGHHLLEDKLSGVVYVDVVLSIDGGPDEPWLEPSMLSRVAELQAALDADEAVQWTGSVLDLLGELRYVQMGGAAAGVDRHGLPSSRADAAGLLLLAELSDKQTVAQTHLSHDRRTLRVTTRAADLGAFKYLQLENRMRVLIDEVFADSPLPVTANIAGTSQVGYGGIDSLIRDLMTSLAWAFGLIFLTLAVLFRSVKLAALSMVPNILPLAVVLGAMGWTGRHLETLSAMVFSIGLGIAVDDTIHYVARWQEEMRKGRTVEEAVRNTTVRTGRAILSTSLVLLIGFGVLRTSAFPPNKSFALLAGGVIVAAVIADLWLLPAMLLIFRPKVRGRAARPVTLADGGNGGDTA